MFVGVVDVVVFVVVSVEAVVAVVVVETFVVVEAVELEHSDVAFGQWLDDEITVDVKLPSAVVVEELAGMAGR